MDNNESMYICISKDEYDRLLEALVTLRFIRKAYEENKHSYFVSDVLKMLFGEGGEE